MKLAHIHCWRLCLGWDFLSKLVTAREIILKRVAQEFATMAWIEVFLELMITANRLDSDWTYSVDHCSQLVVKYICSLWPLLANIIFYYLKWLPASVFQGEISTRAADISLSPPFPRRLDNLKFKKWVIFLQALPFLLWPPALLAAHLP